MYVPCISVDDLVRSGLLPSVQKAIAEISAMILGFDDLTSSEFLFPRLARHEVSKRKRAASNFCPPPKEGWSTRSLSKHHFKINYEIPFSALEGTEEYERIKQSTGLKIAYYEMEQYIDKSDEGDGYRGRGTSRARFAAGSPSRARYAAGYPNRASLNTTIMVDEAYEDFISSEVSEDTPSFCDEDEEELPEEGLGRVGGRYTTPSEPFSKQEVERRKNAKQFPVRRKFTVRRVDNLRKRTCTLAGYDGAIPTSYFCFEALNNYYCKRQCPVKMTVEVELPPETYRWIPIWLFPFVLRKCTGDPLHRALLGGDTSITYYVDMIDASIIRATNTLSTTKGGIPLETAKLCRKMLRAAAAFFEYEEHYNVRERMLDMKDAIMEHKQAILDLQNEVRALQEERRAARPMSGPPESTATRKRKKSSRTPITTPKKARQRRRDDAQYRGSR
jgi:hypothetical protein